MDSNRSQTSDSREIQTLETFVNLCVCVWGGGGVSC